MLLTCVVLFVCFICWIFGLLVLYFCLLCFCANEMSLQCISLFFLFQNTYLCFCQSRNFTQSWNEKKKSQKIFIRNSKVLYFSGKKIFIQWTSIFLFWETSIVFPFFVSKLRGSDTVSQSTINVYNLERTKPVCG